MTNYTEQLMYGLKPVHREEPQAGQSEYYYFDPRYGDDDARHIVDVPDETSPNPNAGAIQQYLYENDEYHYKNLYGNTPLPPTVQTQSNNTQQLRMPTGSQQQITVPSYELQQQLQHPQTNTWDKVKNAANNFAGGTEAFSVGYATGATLGNFDEGMGAATAAVTLNPNNYAMGRDATRQLQNDLQQQHPIAYGVGEFTGAMITPMHLTKGENFKQKAFNALTDTLNASAGYAENWDDFGTNLVANGAANIAGLALDKIPYTRGGGIVGRKFIKQGINSFADKMKNLYYKNEEDEEKYNF